MARKTAKNGVFEQEMIEVDFQDAAGTAVSGRTPRSRRAGGRRVFPAGIFILLLLIETIIAAGASAAYFYYAGRSGIAAIESYTRSYSLPLAEAFGAMTEMCYRSKNYSRLRALFREKIEQRMIGEAFVVRSNGRLIAHSNPEMEKKLKGNIAADEFAYNLDLILSPVRRKSRQVLFTDYNITSKSVPYERDVRAALKKYFYDGIDSTGWLVSRAVFGKKKPVGAVCFIISKDRVFTFLSEHLRRSLLVLKYSLGIALAVSLLVTLVVFMRYRSIQKRAATAPGTGAAGRDGGPVVIRILDEGEAAVATQAGPDRERTIKDAIPVD